MGVDVSLKTETFSNENQEWLGSAHGTDSIDSITLDADLFLAAFTDGVVKSGVALGKITASGKYGPYDNAAVDGRQTAVGLLFTTVDLRGTTAATAKDVWGALLWHGKVIEAKLPVGHGVDAAAKAELTFIRFV